MENVYFVDKMDKNLISYGEVTLSNKIISDGDTSKIYKKNNKRINRYSI